jgi:hypothetical protein
MHPEMQPPIPDSLTTPEKKVSTVNSPVVPGVGRVTPETDEDESRDWRIWLGLALTFFYLVIISLYVANVIGWVGIFNEPIDLVGSFLEGAFAPLAFLWLVIGYFLQKKELMLNTRAISKQNEVIRQSAEQSVIQARAIAATEMHARKESFLRIAASVKQQLGAIMGFLYISSQGTAGSGLVPAEKISELWSAMSEKDPEIFSRQMLATQFAHGTRYAYKLFFGTAIRKRHTDSFIFNFERLLKAAAECDVDGMIHDSLLGTAHGYVYNRAIEFRDNPPEGFTLGVYDFDPDSIDDVGYQI